MSYSLEVTPACKKDINKACRKNPALKAIIGKKVSQILKNPQHYKPLKYDFKGERRVHILKSFILKFRIDGNKEVVNLLEFSHHDDAYRH